jgi:hypothetical protein
VLDSDGVIVVGDTRFKAAQQLGLKEVPVVIAGNLSPEQAKAYRLVDNQSANLSDWDYNLLPIEVNELQAMNYDLNSLGFDAEELAKLLQTGLKDGLCDPDDVPAPPDEPTTRPGDVWRLGDHWLMSGDSANPGDVDRLVDGQPIHLVHTDPPYNVKVEPRSNNAIAAGLSSFEERTIKGLTVTQTKVSQRPGNCGHGIGSWSTTSCPKKNMTACCMPGLAT